MLKQIQILTRIDLEKDVYLIQNEPNTATMEKNKEAIAEKLLEDNLISEAQFTDVKAYRSLAIFSLHNELQFLLYLAVLLFTTGAGILIYKNIDTIGHTIILGLLLLVTGICFYFCFKNSVGFKKEQTDFEHPVYNYLLLAGTILACIFIGYLQFQYKPFGDNYEFPTLLTSLIGFASAYYFDNRSALSIGITGLAASIGITVTPKAVLENDFFDNPTLFYYGIALALLLVLWTEYCEKTHLKKHFSLIYVTFALHLTGICCITGMFGDFWPLYAVFLSVAAFYFYKKSYKLEAISIFVFVLLYGYIGFNILLFKFFEFLRLDEIFGLLTFLYPIYLIGSIYLFIRSIKHFNRTTDDSIR